MKIKNNVKTSLKKHSFTHENSPLITFYYETKPKKYEDSQMYMEGLEKIQQV